MSRITFFLNSSILSPPIKVARLIDVRKEIDIATDITGELIESVMDRIEMTAVSEVPLREGPMNNNNPEP